MKNYKQGFIVPLVIVVVAALAIGGVYYKYRSNISLGSLKSLNQKNIEKAKRTVTVYFKPGTSGSEIVALNDVIKSQKGIVDFKFVTASEALEQFRERHANDELVLKALDELKENPLGANSTIVMASTEQKVQLVTFIKSADGKGIVDRIN